MYRNEPVYKFCFGAVRKEKYLGIISVGIRKISKILLIIGIFFCFLWLRKKEGKSVRGLIIDGKMNGR